MKRLAITPKDIQIITGKSERYGRTQIQKIKLFYKKEPHQILTIEEYSQYTGIELKVILQFLNIRT